MGKRVARHMATGAPKPRRRLGVIILVLAVAGVGLVAAVALMRWGRAPWEAGAGENKAQGQVDAVTDGGVDETEDAVTVGQLVEEPQEPPASELARMFSQGEVGSIRLVGDSITAGFGTDGYADGDPSQGAQVVYDDGAGKVRYESSEASVCWANEFRAYATQRGVSSFVNAGINGAFMQELASNPDAWLGEGADVVFVALGTNDAGYYGPEEYKANAETALAAAAQKSKLVVVLSPVSDLRPESQLVEPAAQLGDVLLPICEEHGYEYVDLRDAVEPSMFSEDGLHPTSEGSLAIWQRIQEVLGF